ncbi:hypothetical protein AGMMS49579_13520 [Spirochaetia bacterium]|nr:hypothetical protein AGMMS49579_13520 [Spirochaetia bacterium]
MVSMTYNEILKSIIRILNYFDVILRGLGIVAKDAEELLAYRERFHNAVMDNRQLEEMLRKLKPEAIIEMYKKCRTLSNKYSPLKFTDNDIQIVSEVVENDLIHWNGKFFIGARGGWEYNAPQAGMGYSDQFDAKVEKIGFRIHATRFSIRTKETKTITLRLWKGDYGKSGTGGEIGFYGGENQRKTNSDMKAMLYTTVNKVCEDVETRIKNSTVPNIVLKMENMIISKLISDYTEISPNRIKEVLDNADRRRLTREQKYIELTDFIAGELKFFEGPDDIFENWGHSLSKEELETQLGLTGTIMQVFNIKGNVRITEHLEFEPEYWTTDFVPKTNKQREEIYTVNHFRFGLREDADRFYESVNDSMPDAKAYPFNYNESIFLERPNDTTVIIVYGDPFTKLG